MSGNQPVLVAIKSTWEPISERPTVGKDVLELLSSSMYVNPLSIYREYIQNAADSIEEATALGVLNRSEPGRVDITVDSDARVVRIRDNGMGVQKSAFTRTLVALGASRKRGTKARGFRGVGRLAGLGYCRELIFRTQVDGEREISEMRWDCQRLKTILRDSSFDGQVEELIEDVVRVHSAVGDGTSKHFFEVELRGIVRHGDDRLMSAETIATYLAQVAPVPFAPEFRFGAEIENRLREKLNFGVIHIYVNGELSPLFRPHRNKFDVRKGVVDEFLSVRFIDIQGHDGRLAATGWVLDHSYLGAVDASASIRGLRLRSGNMQVGETDIVQDLFPEVRFNSWVVGEVHVLDDRILPNGRRDHFEQNVHFANLLSQLRPTTIELSRRCRQSSIRRNVIRAFDNAIQQVLHNAAVVRQGVVGSREVAALQVNTTSSLDQIERLAMHASLQDQERSAMRDRLSRARRQWEKAPSSQRSHQSLKRLTQRERKAVERIFAVLYECSSNKEGAKQLIDRILLRF
jgi:histidine kinase/DNA gyrase B/HSP90-like ATPase